VTRGSIAAAAVALAVLAAGVRWGAMVAGGADSYGYVSQAGLWQGGLPIVQQDIARSSPWPDAAETWAPLGYRPSPHERGAIVPIYAPGLPLLMALLQAVGGFCAAFLVVPLCGALAVWLTFSLGRRVFADDAVGAAGALLLATSPTFLYQLMNAMSDVPVTAFAALALTLALGDRPLVSGVAMSAAIAIRPNLAPLALPLAVWLAVSDRRRAVWFALGVAPAIAGLAWLNATLYESAFVSGYGTTGDLYALRFFASNVRQFAVSILTVEASIVAGAVAALIAYARGRARLATIPQAIRLAGAWIAIVFLSYLFYQPFDAWWYLRFLLPAWPVVMVWAAAACMSAFAGVETSRRRVAVGVLVAVLAARGVQTSASRDVFDLARGERRYIDVARFVASHTDPDAVLLSVQHSGSIRLYTGRLTLRFVVLRPEWLDRTVEHLQSIGRHPYFVLDGAEVDAFRSRFASASRLGRLDWPPVATLGAVVSIYDPLARADVPSLAIARTRGSRGWLRCEPPQSWPPVRRMK
jgi:hypothetical protein